MQDDDNNNVATEIERESYKVEKTETFMHNKSPSPLSLLYFKLRLCGWNDFTLPGGRNLLLGVSSEKQTLFWIALRYFVE